MRRVRPRRDFKAMEERRMRAADLFEQGVRPAEIARDDSTAIDMAVDPAAVLRAADVRSDVGVLDQQLVRFHRW